MNQSTENGVNQSVKVDRKLPPHELNARRARKRAVTQLPAIAVLRRAAALPSVERGDVPEQKTNS